MNNSLNLSQNGFDNFLRFGGEDFSLELYKTLLNNLSLNYTDRSQVTPPRFTIRRSDLIALGSLGGKE